MPETASGTAARSRSADGRLTITARMVNGTLVSGGMSNRLDQTYGFYEFRVRTDADPTRRHAAASSSHGRSPEDGRSTVRTTSTDDRGRGPQPDQELRPLRRRQQAVLVPPHGGGGNRGTRWQWSGTPSAIRIYRDGILAWTLTDTAAIPDVAHHLTIQLDAFKKSMSGTVTAPGQLGQGSTSARRPANGRVN